MKIDYNDKEITFTFPRFDKRVNPYMEDGADCGTYPVFTGLIIHHNKNGNWNEMGFARTIDMDYKGKPDQVSDFIVRWDGGEEEFRAKCKELNLNIHEMET